MDGIHDYNGSTGLVYHVIEIAKTMQYELIAEGIEQECQMAYLKERGIKFDQGL